MKKTALALVAVLLLASSAQAATILYVANLGDFENPPTGSPGTGYARVTIDTILHTLQVQVDFLGLLGTTTAAHIHCCIDAPGNTGVATQTPSFAGFPLGVTAGSMNTTFDMTLASTFNPAFVTASGGTLPLAEARLLAGLAAGQAYLNIHTSRNGGGEIRGFLAVPEPMSMSLLGLGLGALAVARRKRRG